MPNQLRLSKAPSLTFLQLSTDEIVCTPRAVQEHLKKLRKAALGGADSTTRAESSTASPAKPSVKETVFAARVKKSTRKTATGGKGKGKAAANADDAGTVPLASTSLLLTNS